MFIRYCGVGAIRSSMSVLAEVGFVSFVGWRTHSSDRLNQRLRSLAVFVEVDLCPTVPIENNNGGGNSKYRT